MPREKRRAVNARHSYSPRAHHPSHLHCALLVVVAPPCSVVEEVYNLGHFSLHNILQVWGFSYFSIHELRSALKSSVGSCCSWSVYFSSCHDVFRLCIGCLQTLVSCGGCSETIGILKKKGRGCLCCV
jgi:hypothetical protein